MVNRLHKIIGGIASVDAEVHDDVKNIRFNLNCIVGVSAMLEFLRVLSGTLRKVFQDGTEKQNGKTQMKLSAHLEHLDQTQSMSLSEIGLYVATLRDIVEPLVRSKSKAQHTAMEAKRKRGDKACSEKSSSSNETAAPSKKLKQTHDPDPEDAVEADVLPFVAVPWRVTRSHARRGLTAANLEICPAGSTLSEEESDTTSSNRLNRTDEDYEVDNREDGSTSDEASCKVCGYSGRLIHCQGDACDVRVHRGCMIGNKTNDAPWFCSKCARTNRALYRNDRNT